MTTANQNCVLDVLNNATEWLNIKEISYAAGLSESSVRSAVMSLARQQETNIIHRMSYQKAPRKSKHTTAHTSNTENQYWTQDARESAERAEQVRAAEQEERRKQSRHRVAWEQQFKDQAERLIDIDGNKIVSHYDGVSVLAEVTVPAWATRAKSSLVGTDHTDLGRLLFMYRLILERYLIEINEPNYKYEEVGD